MTDHPLTETAAAALWDASRDPGRPAADRHEEMHHDERATAVTAIRAAFNLGREHERTNPEDALRAAREQGWDEAVAWGHDRNPRLINKHGNLAAEWLAANPHRPAPALPTTDGAVIIPAEGREFIEAVVDGKKYRAREAMRSSGDGWYAAWRSFAQMRVAIDPECITPGTWKVDGK